MANFEAISERDLPPALYLMRHFVVDELIPMTEMDIPWGRSEYASIMIWTKYWFYTSSGRFESIGFCDFITDTGLTNGQTYYTPLAR